MIKQTNHDDDCAIADFTKAIQLMPELVAAYNARATSKLNKSDKAGAMADLNQQIKLSQSGR